MGLRVGEERRVVQGDDDRNARELRGGVVGGVKDVGAHLSDEGGEPRLFPRHACRA